MQALLISGMHALTQEQKSVYFAENRLNVCPCKWMHYKGSLDTEVLHSAVEFFNLQCLFFSPFINHITSTQYNYSIIRVRLGLDTKV